LAILLVLGACSAVPGTGPLGDALLAESAAGGARAFDVVKVDDAVVAALEKPASQPFHRHFGPHVPPPRLPIAIGDRLSVVIWESSARGLFGASRPPRPPRLTDLAEALGPDEAALAALKGADPAPGALIAPLTRTAKGRVLLQTFGSGGRLGTQIPDQPVGRDGGISIPYAGRIPAAGHDAEAVQAAIEHRLAGRALDPQALVIVRRGPANSVTVTGELVAGNRVPIDPGGSRLLHIIAAAGGTTGPVDDAYVRLSRDGAMASVPFAALVERPDDDIYARPGDILAVVRQPRTVSVFGPAGHSTAVTFERDVLSLDEALGQAGGLSDAHADPRAVFVLRYEKPAVVAALGLAPLPAARDGPSPVAYRFDLADAKSYALARRFAMRDQDVIYVAEAESEPIRKFLAAVGAGVRSVLTGLLVCYQTKC
jgi:polysaccharide export outer membrane protein